MGYGRAAAEMEREQTVQSGFCGHRNHFHPCYQEKIMRVPYGPHKEYFKYSLFLVFCNIITTSAVSAGVLLASGKALDAIAPLYKYGIISVSNILTTTCQYETLAKCAKMIPVMIWGTVVMLKKYNSRDYLLAFLVTLGRSLFILDPAAGDISPYSRGRESTVWGVPWCLVILGLTASLVPSR